MSDGILVQPTKLEIGNASTHAATTVWTKVGEMIDFDGPGPESEEVEMTHTESTAKEWKLSLPDYGDFSANFNCVPTDAGQVLMQTYAQSRGQRGFRLTYSDNGTTKFDGYVKRWRRTGEANGKVQRSGVIRITGEPVEA